MNAAFYGTVGSDKLLYNTRNMRATVIGPSLLLWLPLPSYGYDGRVFLLLIHMPQVVWTDLL